MKFVLILTLFGLDQSDLSYVVDYDMTGQDCIQRLQDQQMILEQTFHSADFELSCSIDEAQEG